MSTYTSRVNELEDLVTEAFEREWTELKSWVDLSTKNHEARAQCARHLAAMANYGGGYLIFGFNDDGTRCARKDDVRTAYGHDVFAAIIDKYLQPKFQCEVSFPERAGVEHAVVWIPAHGASPVIAKADGPQDARGVVQGIKSGTVYVRTPKPESVAASTPEHWEKIIQRCVLARRDEMVTMFSAIVSGGGIAPKVDASGTREKLAAWHQATQRAALEATSGRTGFRPRSPVADNFVQFSYLIRHRDGETIAAGRDALAVIEKLNTAVRDTVRTGWSMFFPFATKDIGPIFAADPAVDGGDTEFVQANVFARDSGSHGDFWRIGLDGRASLFRNFHEDVFQTPRDVPERQKWFDPRLQTCDVTEVVRHARAFAEEFSEPTEVHFLLEWNGLKDRIVGSHRASYSEQYVAKHDSRTIYLAFPYAEVIGNLPGVVARLLAPVYRMFDPHGDISAAYIARLLPTFIEPGV